MPDDDGSDVSLNVFVAGLWHLGCVTASCAAAAGHRVTAYDSDADLVSQLKQLKLPVSEPGLHDLTAEQIQAGRLVFADTEAAAASADIVWVTWDTPVDDRDCPDAEWVLGRIERLFSHLRDDTIVVVSSQLPVGSVADLERRFAAAWPARRISFACVPENLRLGSALDGFMHRDSVVVGIRRDDQRERLMVLLSPFAARFEWMRVESAEMTKHALNAFLATSVAFINEIAALCEHVGADAAEVSRGIRLDRRIGRHAYVTPGAAFSGGTLARDIVALTGVATRHSQPVPVLGAVKPSNDHHRQWALARLQRELGSLRGRTIGVWGLTYKPGTDTLRRSGAVELCTALAAAGARVRAYDPAVSTLEVPIHAGVTLADSAAAAARNADALVVATNWHQFRSVQPDELVVNGGALIVLDANGFLADTLGRVAGIRYLEVGRG
jgi:UDPglucose 6-dehydrogenase